MEGRTLECITRHRIDGLVEWFFDEIQVTGKDGLKAKATLYLTNNPAAHPRLLINN